MNDEPIAVSFKWSGPKSTWTEEEWQNYRSMPWWLQRLVDLFSVLASVVLWVKRRGAGSKRSR